MNRIHNTINNQEIQYAHSIIPKKILDKLYFDYLIGADPIYTGLFFVEETFDERSYRKIACVAYPFHQLLPKDKQKTTIVIPGVISWWGVIHEIGHVLDGYLDFSHTAKPLTEYAKRGREESFAEAFVTWLTNGYAKDPVDLKTLTLFRSFL